MAFLFNQFRDIHCASSFWSIHFIVLLIRGKSYAIDTLILFIGIPVFVDSRSELYCKEFNEDVTIFDDYMSIINGDEHYSRIFDKYKITHILVKNDSIENVYISRDSKYKVEYQDDKFVLYEKKK